MFICIFMYTYLFKFNNLNSYPVILIYTGEIPGKSTMSKIQLTDEIFGPALDDVSRMPQKHIG